MNPLVTLLTPCYNGEKYLDNYFKMVIDQEYDNIQLILVNDGSTDNTAEIVKRWKEKLENKLTEFLFITQKNGGQASACKNGLQYVKGKYFIWCDIDDALTPDAISYKVEFLQKNPQYGFCRANAQCFDENGNKLEKFVRHNTDKHDIFEDLITQNDIMGFVGIYMIDFDLYREANPNLEFYCGKGGQNWQILLPIALRNKCGFIDEIQYHYLLRSDSHSHSINTYEKDCEYIKEHEDTLKNTVSILKLSEKELKYYIDFIENIYCHMRFTLCWKYNDKHYIAKFKEILKYDKVTFKEIVKFLLIFFKIRWLMLHFKHKN